VFESQFTVKHKIIDALILRKLAQAASSRQVLNNLGWPE